LLKPVGDSVKPRFSKQPNDALTLIEVLLVILVLAIIAALMLPAMEANRRKRLGEGCMNNLKQISFTYESWAWTHGGKFPVEVSVSNGGTMELAATGDVVATFQVMSNELKTPKTLICPADTIRFATNFSNDFTAKNISYFIGLKASTNFPQAFLSGDDNFSINGIPAKSGLLELSTNAPVDWTEARHGQVGYIGLADGSVHGTHLGSLRYMLIETSGVITNRLAIP
jgi:competence protein ComGC